jgi:hypothetical protein
VGVGLSDEYACEPKHGNAAIPVLSPGSSSSGRGNSRGSGSRSAHELRTVITSGRIQSTHCVVLWWWWTHTLCTQAARTLSVCKQAEGLVQLALGSSPGGA